MIRRYVSYLLIAGYLASQLAAVPHAHAGFSAAQQTGHDACPHVHFSWHFSWFGYLGDGHDDHSCDGSHSHSSDSDSALSHEGHDSHAVYLPSEVGAPSLTAKSAVSLDDFQLASPPACTTLPVLAAICGYWADGDFPGKSNPGCPLYLALRALRI